MTYYQATNLESEAVICDDCGETRWAVDARYGSNVDARLEEARETGVRWSWVPLYSSTPTPCLMCKAPTK